MDPAPVFEVSDMALSIPEVWDFYLLLNASFFFIIIFRFFIDFSLLSSPGYSLSSPGAPPDRKKKNDFFIKIDIFQYFAYKPIIDRSDGSKTMKI